jgi:hypothetical protein
MRALISRNRARVSSDIPEVQVRVILARIRAKRHRYLEGVLSENPLNGTLSSALRNMLAYTRYRPRSMVTALANRLPSRIYLRSTSMFL